MTDITCRKIAPLTFAVFADGERIGEVWCVNRSHWLFAPAESPSPRTQHGCRKAAIEALLAEIAAGGLVTDPERAAAVLAAAPAHAEFVMMTLRNRDRRQLRLMARDLPRAGRRLTCLSTGTEWFDVSVETLERIGFVSLRPVPAEHVAPRPK